MNIEKIIKGYFMFVLIVLGIAITKDMPMATQYLASVLHRGESANTEQSEENTVSGITVTEVPFEINVDNEGFNPYIVPGEKNRDAVTLQFAALNENISLKNLRVLIDGVSPMIIKNAYLMKGDEILAKAKKKDDLLQFSDFNLTVEAGSSEKLVVRFDLSTYAKAGERFRLIMNEPDDLGVNGATGKYTLPPELKIKGPYLSVVGKRTVRSHP